MANSVDAVIGSEAIKQVESLIAKLTQADAELIKISQSAIGASKGISSISTPSGLEKSVSNVTALNTELTKQNAIIAGLETQIKKLSTVRAVNNKMSAEEAVNQRILNQNALAQAKSVSNLVGAYDKLSLAHQKAFKEAQNIGAQYGSTSKEFAKATEKANLLDTELKAVDATLGKHNRNVGNYKSGFNGLGNSINQITRELPAFTFSAQTGFLALSNNIPILTDEIGKLVQKNKELKASGEQTTSVFKQIATGFFSLQTLMGVGILLFTLYGKEITEFAKSMFGSSKAIDANKISVQSLKEATQEAKKATIEENTQLTINLAIAKDVNLSMKERLIAVDEIQKQYPAYLGNLSKQQILAGDTAIAERELRDAILARAKATAATSKITENQLLIIDLEEERLQVVKELDSAQRNYNNRLKIYEETKDPTVNTALAQSESRLSSSKKELLSIDKEIASYSEVNNRLTNYAIENSKKSVKLSTEVAKAIKKEKEAKREDVQAIENLIKVKGTLIEEIDKEIDRLRTESIINAGKPEEHEKTRLELENLLKVRRELNGLPTADVNILVPVKPEDVERVKEMSEQMKAYLSSFSSEFMSNSGFSETFAILNKQIEGFGENFAVTFNAIAESAQEAFNFISNASQANFDAEYARLESQKETALKFAGDSASARTKIEEDAEKKKKEIANRENKAKQKQAIFNIAIDTAQGIVSALASTPPNIPLSIAIGAIGALQIGLVASQKVPQYFDGTDNHIGGMMLVNDGAGSNYKEKVILPNGKEIMPEGRNVLMNAPKGTKVLTHEQQIMQMLNESGISMNANYNKNNGMTAQEMDSVMAKHFSKIQTNVTNIDQNGIRTWSESNGNKTIRNNNRVSRTGFSV